MSLSVRQRRSVIQGLRLFYWLVLALVLLVGCRPAGTSTPTASPILIKLGASDSVRSLAETVVSIYGDEVPSVTFETIVGNADTFLADLPTHQVDIALVPGVHNMHPFEDASVGGSKYAVALDGLALVVNQENPVTGLTLEQVQMVFQGEAWSWEVVGGPAVEIELATREEGSAVRALFAQLVMRQYPIALTAVVLPDTDAVLDYVALHPWAIGFATYAVVDGRAKMLAIEGLPPSPETLAKRSYPLCFTVYAVAFDEPQGALRELVAWMLSTDGQAVIGRNYGRVRGD